jgi:arsenate reductase-like glutaredoxin family protein
MSKIHEDQLAYSHLSREELVKMYEKSQALVTQLNKNCHDYRLKIEILQKKEVKAEHFDILMKAVKENEVVRGAWGNFMMSLRLTGYDE